MSKKITDLLEIAKKTALSSDNGHRHGCIVVLKKTHKIISCAYNTSRKFQQSKHNNPGKNIGKAI